MQPGQKGAIAEAAIALAATRLGLPVLRPIAEGGRYDLVPRLLRVQCKWAVRKGAVISAALSTSRLTPTRGYVRTCYSETEIDAVGLYCAEFDRCYLIPIEVVTGRSCIHLRLAAARNNQELGVHWAADYEFAGAVAQLGERRHGMAEARGSSPLSSIV